MHAIIGQCCWDKSPKTRLNGGRTSADAGTVLYKVKNCFRRCSEYTRVVPGKTRRRCFLSQQLRHRQAFFYCATQQNLQVRTSNHLVELYSACVDYLDY